MKAIIVEQENRVVEILTAHLSGYGLTVEVFSTATTAVKYLKENVVQLIISRNILTVDDDPQESARQVLNHVYDQEARPKVIIMGDVEFADIEFNTLPDRFRIEEFDRAVIKCLNLSKEQIEYMKLPDYVPIAISNFYLMHEVPCDIYIKIGRKGSDNKFIKRIHAGDEIDKTAVKKYEKLELREFFVKKEFKDDLLNELLSQSIKTVESKLGEGDDACEVISDSFDIASNLIDTVGINSQTVRIVEATLHTMDASIKKGDRLGALFKSLLSNKLSYSYRRAHLMSMMFYEILPDMGWGKGDQLQLSFEKLNFVSFFHDILLRDEKLLRIHSSELLKATILTDKEKELVENHANKISTLVQSYPHAPAGSDILVRQHHGVKNGIGFADSCNSNISAMAIAFIVVEEFVVRLLDRESASKEDAIFVAKVLEEKFTLSVYKKTLTAIQEHLERS